MRFVCDPGGTGDTATAALFALVVLVSLAGYLGFLVMFPEAGKGDTIKATYMLHVFPFVAFLAAQALEGIRRRTRTWHRVLVVCLVVVFLHNLPAMITRYVR